MAILIDGLDMPEQGEYKHLRIYDNGDVTVEVSDGEAVIAHAVPAADVRPVVLCRDCKMQQYCKVAQYLGENGFCSNGEKDVRSSGKCKLYKDCEYRALWNCCCEDCNMME